MCREVRFDGANPDSPYSPHGLLSVLRPDGEFPLVWYEPVYLYAEHYGDAAEYDVWFDLIRFVTDDQGEVVDEVEDGRYGPFLATLVPHAFINGRSYFLLKLPLQAPGVHELQLRVAGVAEPLIHQPPIPGQGVIAMPKKHRLKQPTAPSRTTAEPPVFHLQTLPDPDACLTDEQKTWPLCNTWKPYEPPAPPLPADQPPQPTLPVE